MDSPVTDNLLSDTNSTLAGMLLFNMKQAALTDDHALAVIGFSDELIQLIASMDMEEIAQYARYGSRYLNISIDPKKFEQIHNIIRVRNDEQQLINNLLRANISYQFLYDHFGLTSNEISVYKTRLRIKTKVGRGKALTDREIRTVYQLLKKERVLCVIRRNRAHWYPELVLEISCQTDLDASKIASLVSQQDAEKLIMGFGPTGAT